MNALELTEPDPLMLHKGADKLREQMAELDNIALALDEDVAKAGKMISDANMKRLVAAMDAIKGILEASGAAGPDEGGVAGGKMTKGSGNKMDLKDILKALPEDQRKQVEAELAKAEQLEKKVEELQKGQPQPTPGPEDIWKGINPEIRKQFEDMKKRAEEAEKLAKAEKEARENAEFEKRASAYSHVGSAKDIAKMLKQAYAVSEEYGKQVEQTLKSAQERIGKGGLFREIGNEGQSSGNDAITKLNAAADEIRKSQPTLTKEQAFTKALEANPDLYEEYQRGM
jgi:DNA-binding transcriptional ArsR family regulator